VDEPAHADRRRRNRVIFAILAGLAYLTILRLGFGMTFFSDEWAFIQNRSLADPATWWGPHNEHWSTIPVLVYRAMVETVGIGSYVPYLALVALLHLAVATLVYALLERSSGPLLALSGSAIVLFFGSGLENVYWGFQIGFVGALAFGLGAIWLTELGPTQARALAAAMLLLASVATQGVGLFMCVAVGIEWLLDPRWRRYVIVLVIPAAAFLAWYVAIGRFGVATFRDPFSSDALLAISPSIMRGLSNAFGAIAGLPLFGFVVFAAFTTWGTRNLVRDDLHPRVIGLLAAIAVQYALIGAVRAQLFDGAIDYTRYTYVSGILALSHSASWLGDWRYLHEDVRGSSAWSLSAAGWHSRSQSTWDCWRSGARCSSPTRT